MELQIPAVRSDVEKPSQAAFDSSEVAICVDHLLGPQVHHMPFGVEVLSVWGPFWGVRVESYLPLSELWQRTSVKVQRDLLYQQKLELKWEWSPRTPVLKLEPTIWQTANEAITSANASLSIALPLLSFLKDHSAFLSLHVEFFVNYQWRSRQSDSCITRPWLAPYPAIMTQQTGIRTSSAHSLSCLEA